MNPNFDIYKDFNFAIFIHTHAEDIKTFIERRNLFENNYNISLLNSEKVDFSLALRSDSILEYKSIWYTNINGNTIYVDNTGEAYYSLIWNVCTRNKLEAVHIKLSDDNATYPGYMMNYYNINGEERAIQCYKDGEKWMFHTEGKVQFFEDNKRYSERIKRKRFNREVIIEYCKRLGLDITDSSFWEPVGNIYYFERL